jgi:hypothetical protein
VYTLLPLERKRKSLRGGVGLSFFSIMLNFSVYERLLKSVVKAYQRHTHNAESATLSSVSPVKQILSEQWFAQWMGHPSSLPIPDSIIISNPTKQFYFSAFSTVK